MSLADRLAKEHDIPTDKDNIGLTKSTWQLVLLAKAHCKTQCGSEIAYYPAQTRECDHSHFDVLV